MTYSFTGIKVIRLWTESQRLKLLKLLPCCQNWKCHTSPLHVFKKVLVEYNIHNPATCISCMFLREILENVLAIRKPSKIAYFTFKVPEIFILSKTLSLLSINAVFNTSASVFCYSFSLEIIL